MMKFLSAGNTVYVEPERRCLHGYKSLNGAQQRTLTLDKQRGHPYRVRGKCNSEQAIVKNEDVTLARTS